MSGHLHSFVVPVYNEELVLRELCARLDATLAAALADVGDGYEIILVDDGSTDGSTTLARELHDADPERIKLVALSRNFGHQAAITAGTDLARGKTVTVLDADLQDPPEVILEMIERWREGYDVVYGVRRGRAAETLFKRATAAAFYRLLRRSTQIDIPLDTGDFRLMSRKAADALTRMRESHRFVRGMVSWVGFRQTAVRYDRAERFAGATKFPLGKMARFAWDGFTGFSFVPLRLATYLGVLSSALSVVIALWALWIRLFTDRAVQGWTSLMVAILFLGGVQLFTVGVLGEYVGRIFEQSKQRPLYLIDYALGDLGRPVPGRARASGEDDDFP